MSARSFFALSALALAACPDPSTSASTTTSTSAGAAPSAPPEPAPPPPSAAPPAPAEPAEPVEIVLWHAYRAKEKEALESVVESWNRAQSEVAIRVQAIPYDPFVDKVTITIPRGQGPDLFVFAHNMIGAWEEDGLLEPLGTRVPPDVLESFVPETVKALVYRKNLYGLPLAFKGLVLYRNKAFLPDAPASMEELREKAKAVQAANPGTFGLLYEAGLLYQHAPWVHAFGGSVFDAEGKPALSTDAWIESLRFARALHADDGIVPKGMTGFMIASAWNEGKAAACLNGPWFRAEIREGVDYEVSTIPPVDAAGEKKPKPFLGIEAVFVSARSEKKDAAVKAALHLAGAESAKVRMEVGRQPVAHAATLAEGAQGDPALAVFERQAKDSVLMPSVPEMQLVWSTADLAIQGAVFAGRDPKEELEKAQAKVVEDVSKRGR